MSLKSFDSSIFERASKVAANQAKLEMDTFVPKRSGELRSSGRLVGTHTIRYSQPYAKAQFYGFVKGSRVRNYHTPGTSRRWDLRLKGDSAKMNNIARAAGKEIMRDVNR